MKKMKKQYRIFWLLLIGMVMLSTCQMENNADGETIEAERLPRVIMPIEFGVAPEEISAGLIAGEAAWLNIDLGVLKQHIGKIEIRPKFSGRNIRWELWASASPLGDTPSADPNALKVAGGIWNYAAGAVLSVDFMESDDSLVTWRFDARYLQLRQIITGAVNAAFQDITTPITVDAYGHFSGVVDKTRLGEACVKGIEMMKGISIYKNTYKTLYAELYGEYDEQGQLLRYGAVQEMSRKEDPTLPSALKLARQLDIDSRTEQLCDAIQTVMLGKK